MSKQKVRLVDKDLGWAELFKRVNQIKHARVKVGVFSDETYEGSDFTVGEIAAVHEFGRKDGHIKSRSFLRSTFDEKFPELVKLGKRLVDKVLFSKKMTVERALNVLGSTLAKEVKLKITTGAGVPPPLADSTIKAKGSSRPLVDTSRLLGAITWMVSTLGALGGESYKDGKKESE